MGTDYYRCSNCDLQVNDCTSYYDICCGCGAIICWNCAFDFGYREKSPDYDSPGDYIPNNKFKMEKVVDKHFPDESWYELLNCPLCKKRSEEEQKEKVLKYLLKKNKLTLKKAIKEMNSAGKS